VLCAGMACSCLRIATLEQTSTSKPTWADRTHYGSTGRRLKLLLDHVRPIKIRLNDTAVLFTGGDIQ
jgi:hypothetical protein